MRQRLPFPLLGLDSDKGSEFINHQLYAYCQKERITFTHSRSYKKNDSCHIEQKNGNVCAVWWAMTGYTSHAAYHCLEKLYLLVRLYINFFQPTMKLLCKTRNGARVHKVYDKAQTPYQPVTGIRCAHRSKKKRAGGYLPEAQSGTSSETD